MTRDDGLKAGGVEHAGLDKLQEAGFVLGAAGLKRDGGEVFGGENAHRRSSLPAIAVAAVGASGRAVGGQSCDED